MLAEKESAAHRTRNRPLCNLKTRKTGTGFYACPLFSILKMLLSLRRRRGTASRKHNPYQYRIFSQGNSVCAYIAFETHIRCKTDNFALFAPPNKKSNLYCPPTKRELAGYDAGINATDDDSLKADLQAAFDRKSVLLKKQEAALKDFTKQTGLARDRSREQVPAHFVTVQGKTFNKSVSQKTVQANKRALQNKEKNSILKRKKAYARENIRAISDKTFNNLTIEARKNGAIILRGTPEVEFHLDSLYANASTVGDIMFFRRETTISEVLEEVYHFKQYKAGMFEEYSKPLHTYYKEIDAKEYLIKNTKKYNIPRQETDETIKQLEYYKKRLEQLTRGENDD